MVDCLLSILGMDQRIVPILAELHRETRISASLRQDPEELLRLFVGRNLA